MKTLLRFILFVLTLGAAHGAETFPSFITGQPPAGTLTGNELLPLIQSGGTVTLTPNTLKTWLNTNPTWGNIIGTLSNQSDLTTALASKAATTVTINGHPLSANITVSASDLTTGTLPAAQLPASAVQTTGSYNNPTWLTGLVPATRTVNGHALSSNIVVSASDITTGTLPATQLPNTGYISAIAAGTGINVSMSGLVATITASGGSGGLSNITESLKTTVPNNSTNVEVLTVTGGGTNTALALVPKGPESYFALAAADGTAVGGNVRGAHAVDLQMSRTSAMYVAQSTESSILGGANNATDDSSSDSVIGGGTGNNITTSDFGVIGGGQFNTIYQAEYGVIAGGWVNYASGQPYVTIGGGEGNTNGGLAATVAGGANNVVGTNGVYGWIPGGQTAQVLNLGQGAWSAGSFTSPGDAQAGEYVLRAEDFGNGMTELFLDGISAELSLPLNSCVQLLVLFVGTTEGGAEIYSCMRQVIVQTDPAGNCTLVGGPTVIGADQFTGSMNGPGITTSGTAVQFMSGYSSDGAFSYWVARVIGVQVVFP